MTSDSYIMKINTRELTGAALDWAVAKCEGVSGKVIVRADKGVKVLCLTTLLNQYSPSTYWAHGGPIIERNFISVQQNMDGDCSATMWIGRLVHQRHIGTQAKESKLLIAAMRCYVASKLGDEVEVPDELLSP